MITKPNALIQAACISLLFMLLPGCAALEGPKESAEEQQPAEAAVITEQQEPAPGPTMTPPQEAVEPQAAEPEEELSQPMPEAEPSASSAEKQSVYKIKRGDTLWDIANAFFKDPFLWPFIWKANPSVTNPDLIYAGNTLMIPSLAPVERAMQAPSGPAAKKELAEEQAPAAEQKPGGAPPAGAAEEEVTAGGAKIVVPEEEAQPITDKYSFLSAGFVNDLESAGEIVGPAVQGKTIMGYDDVVYVRFHSGDDVNIGDKFLIYAPLGNVKHPRTGELYGRLIRGLGILEVTAKDPDADVVTARITLSFDAIEGGTLLTPYQEPMLVFPSSDTRAKDISGYILEVTDHRTLNGQLDFVYLDIGRSDGVDPGDKFLVYTDPAKPGYPREMIGEVQVFLVKERSSTAVVRKSTYVLSKGQAVEFKR